jgi:hypothetical protein
MSREREPVRWLDGGDDCDPALRAALGHARRSLPDAEHAEALARSIEARVSTSAAHGGGALRLGIGLSGIGLAALLLYFAALRGWDRQHAPAQPSAVSIARSTAAQAGFGNVPERSAHGSPPGLQRPPQASFAATRQQLGGDSSVFKPAGVEAAPTGRDATSKRSASTTAGRPRTPQLRAVVLGDASAREARAAGSTRDRDSSSSAALPSVTASVDVDETVASTRQSNSGAPKQKDVPSELQLLMAAQRALRVSAAKALGFAEQHARAYPTGNFAAEREEIAITALSALGDTQRARQRARAFLERYPSSLARGRVQQLLERLPR